jgi:hypothetical protein
MAVAAGVAIASCRKADLDPSVPYERLTAKVGDRFGSAGDTVLVPRTLCLPTSKNESKLIQPRAPGLLQRQVGRTGTPRTLCTQYGILRSTIGTRNLLCVPSLKRLTLG